MEPIDFYLAYHSKSIKDEHCARDLPHGAWVSINFRGHGSGKRASTGAAKKTEEEKSKDEIIDELKHVIDNTLKNVGSPKSLEFQQALGHIKKLAVEVERNPDSISDLLQMLDRGSLMKFNAVNGHNDKSMPQKIRVLKTIFSTKIYVRSRSWMMNEQTLKTCLRR